MCTDIENSDTASDVDSADPKTETFPVSPDIKSQCTRKVSVRTRTYVPRIFIAMSFTVFLSLIGLLLAMIQFIQPTFSLPVYVTAIWYLFEVLFGFVILAHIIAYVWEGIRLGPVDNFFSFLLALFGAVTFVYALISGISAMGQKQIIVYATIAAIALMFEGIVDFLYYFRRHSTSVSLR